MTGSSSTGRASRAASRMAIVPAILNAISEESTSWWLPSIRSTATSTSGNPASGPFSSDDCNPASTELMYSRGITPPRMLSANTYPSPGSDGRRLITTTAYWPEPPVCLMWRYSNLSTGEVIVSR